MLAVELLDLHFNRHAVTIPTRHIRRIKTRERFRFDDNVFEDFIHGVTDVNIAIGIGWAIVQHKAGPTDTGLAYPFVPSSSLPLREHCRFALS